MLNNFFDKFIFTGTLKYSRNNFFLIDIPFLITPVETIASISEINDAELHKRIYESVKKNTREHLMKEFSSKIGSDKRKQIGFLKDFFVGSGWGQIQIIDLQIETKKAIIVVDNSPFATKLRGRTKLPADVFLRGIIAGIFSRIFEGDVDCVEVECVALNNERCKFVVKEKNEFDFSNSIILNQLNY